MEFNCYDVLEVQGSRYIITEKIKYNEIIPKADQEQAYKAKPSMQKSPGDYWHEYGLEAVEGTDKIWVTIEYNDNAWCTVSRTSYRKRAPKGFTLHQIGLEKVVDVDGDSGASVGDRAGYKEYQLPCEGGASVFFEENWFKGEKMFAEGSRVQLVNIKLCNDAAANAVRKKKRNQHYFGCSLLVGILTFLGMKYVVPLASLILQRSICMIHPSIILRRIRIMNILLV